MNEPQQHTLTGRAERPGGHVIRSAAALMARLVLLLPLRVARSVLYFVSRTTENLADVLVDVERVLHPICEMPFHADLRRQIAEAEESERLKLMRRIADSAPRH